VYVCSPIDYGGDTSKKAKNFIDNFLIFKVDEILKRFVIIFLSTGVFAGLFFYDYYGNQIVELVRVFFKKL
jgi:hypothetical protein